MEIDAVIVAAACCAQDIYEMSKKPDGWKGIPESIDSFEINCGANSSADRNFFRSCLLNDLERIEKH